MHGEPFGVTEILLQPGIPEVGKLAVLNGGVVRRIGENVIHALLRHLLHQLHAVIRDHGDVGFAVKHFSPVVRHLHLAQHFVGFVLGVDDSLVAGDRAFKFFPDICSKVTRGRPITVLRPAVRTEMACDDCTSPGARAGIIRVQR